jgi:hypothetical protein
MFTRGIFYARITCTAASPWPQARMAWRRIFD